MIRMMKKLSLRRRRKKSITLSKIWVNMTLLRKLRIKKKKIAIKLIKKKYVRITRNSKIVKKIL